MPIWKAGFGASPHTYWISGWLLQAAFAGRSLNRRPGRKQLPRQPAAGKGHFLIMRNPVLVEIRMAPSNQATPAP